MDEDYVVLDSDKMTFLQKAEVRDFIPFFPYK